MDGLAEDPVTSLLVLTIPAELLLKGAFGLLPVFAFLSLLLVLDSFKLVRFRSVLATIAAGIVSAIAAMIAGSLLSDSFDIPFSGYSRFIAPVLEELLKASYLFYLLRTERIGFSVDGAICGFGIGAGFAAVENIWYIQVMPDASLLTWLIRGFGTAFMHGGTTAIAAVIAKTLGEQHRHWDARTLLPGLTAAIAIHLFYNQFFVSPVSATVLVLLTLPMLMVYVFQRSERVLRRWLHVGFDSDQELLHMIVSGNISATPVGVYFQSLQTRFRPETVVDMICYLRLHLELTIQAKGILIMREAGFNIPPAPDVREKFAELRALTHTIGRTGRLALLPFLHTSGRALWQLHMLDQG